jgi:hypothetical protein
MADQTAGNLPGLSVLSGSPWQPLGAAASAIAARLGAPAAERQHRRCRVLPNQLELFTAREMSPPFLPSRTAGRRVRRS